MRRSLVLGAFVAAATFLHACDVTPGTGELSVLLTDAADPRIGSAVAYVSTIYVIRGSDTTGPRDTISSTPRVFDLLDLQNGVTAFLGSITLPTGTVQHVRAIVDSAMITLAAPNEFNDGTTTRTLKVPSGMTSGVKVNFSEPLVIVPGTTIAVVDFDVSRNFVLTGPENNPTGVLFKPVLHATVMTDAGSISGTVTPASSHASVFAILNATDTVQTALADTITGAYVLRFLPPGSYTVAASGTGVSASKVLTLRPSQDTTGVNFP